MADRIRRLAGASVGTALLALVVVAGLFGSQVSARNPANYLVWLYFWPGVAIAVALVGDFWRYVNPWRLGGLQPEAPPTGIRSTGVWPAVVAFAAFAWFDLASGLSDRPRYLAIAALVFTAFVLIPAAFAGLRWLARAEPFGLVMAAIGRTSLPALLKPSRSAKDPAAAGWDRFVLYMLPLAAAIFDATLATPQWLSMVNRIGGAAGLERGGPIFTVVRTAGLSFTVAAVGALILGIAAIVGPGTQLSRTATRLALVTLPAAVALMAAHNLPALLGLGPELPSVLGAFVSGQSLVGSASPVTPMTASLVSPLWTAEFTLMIVGLVWSGWLAWRELSPAPTNPVDRFANAYPAWILLVLTSGFGLWILYQPAAAITPP